MFTHNTRDYHSIVIECVIRRLWLHAPELLWSRQNSDDVLAYLYMPILLRPLTSRVREDYCSYCQNKAGCGTKTWPKATQGMFSNLKQLPQNTGI